MENEGTQGDLVRKLKALIEENENLSQRKVAKEANISESYLSAILKLRRRLTVGLLFSLLEICGITPYELFRPKEDKKPPLPDSTGSFEDLTEAERQLINRYRQLAEDRKSRVEDFVEIIYEGQEK